MDLTDAAVRYDSDLGGLRVTFRGDLPVNAHQATAFSGRISSSGKPGNGCDAPAAPGDLVLTAETHSGSAGEVRRGSADLSGALALTGTVEFAADDAVTFAFSDPALAGHDYRCAAGLQATWTNSQDVKNLDEVAPFCIAAGCSDAASAGKCDGSSHELTREPEWTRP